MINMRALFNAHGLKALLRPVDNPNVNLGVASDERHDSIPMLIFTEQHLPVAKPEFQPFNQIPYEKAQRKGSGAVLSLEDFETENFSIGSIYGGDY